MKIFLLSALLLINFQSFAQEVLCPSPTYFPVLSSLLRKRISDVLIGLQEDSTITYHHCFRGNSDHPDWIFLTYRSAKQQVTFIFIKDRVNMILIDGAHCPCLGEFEYLEKWWTKQGSKAKYLNKNGDAEAVVDVSGELDCMSIKAVDK